MHPFERVQQIRDSLAPKHARHAQHVGMLQAHGPRGRPADQARRVDGAVAHDREPLRHDAALDERGRDGIAHRDHAVAGTHDRRAFMEFVMHRRHEREAPAHARETRDERAGHHVGMDDVRIETIDETIEARDHRRHAPRLARLLQQHVIDAVAPQQRLEAAAGRSHHDVMARARLHAGKVHHHVDGAVADRLRMVGEVDDFH